MGADATIYEQLPVDMETAFTGYTELNHESQVIAITTDDAVVDTVSEGMQASVFVKETPFYATMGGQTGDTGIIKTDNGTFVVQDTIKVVGGKICHVGYVESGEVNVADHASLSVDSDRRALICKNHSATHLLQKALKLVLGNHVEQAGSSVTEDRLRFDFTHMQAMTKEEIQKVEEIVNKEIEADLPVNTAVMSLEDAKKTGAMALFGEKYGESVRVVSMGDFSKELCGGTHVPNTGVISTFKIVSEQGIAANVRRIEALTSKGAFDYYRSLEEELAAAAKAAKTDPSKLADKIEALQAELKSLHSENQKLKDQLAKEAVSDVMDSVEKFGDISILPVSVKGVDMNALRNLGDDFKNKLGSAVIIMASDMGDKVNLLIMASDDAVKAGVHAGNIVRKIAPAVGGGGGGRPNMAQAGGKNPAGIEAALAEGVAEAKAQLA
jgi:alanyl-tRNA synthetase